MTELQFTTSILEFPSLKSTCRYGSKVKTGCRTCKTRRVKCDETRPYCSRCTRTGRKCSGYAQAKSVQSPAPTVGRTSLLEHIPQTPTLMVAGDGVHYLEFYHHCAERLLSNGFDNGFWSRTTLQMAQSEPAVRHALIALGYLNKTESGSLKHARSSFAVADHQRSTLFIHYNKAVRYLVDRMAEPSFAPEIGLVSCILFVCIEFLRGNYHTAFTHLSSGLQMVSEWQKGRLTRASPGLPPSILPVFVRKQRPHPSTQIDNNLTLMFTRAITSALLYGVSVEKLIEIPVPYPRNYLEQPFATIVQAQVAHLEIRNASLLFARTMGQKLFLQQPPTFQDLDIRDQLIESHHSWLAALQTFEQVENISEDDQVIISSLRVGYYATYVALACATEIRQSPYDTHIESFKALNSHARVVLNSLNLPHSRSTLLETVGDNKQPQSSPSIGATAVSSPSANFTFEISLIPPLHYVATRCRCPRTRRDAVALLELNPPREALWDAEQHVAVAKRVIQIEERDVDPIMGWPVEASRLWTAVIDGNMDRNGGFWVTFALADWFASGARGSGGKRRADAQWEEWFVL